MTTMTTINVVIIRDDCLTTSFQTNTWKEFIEKAIEISESSWAKGPRSNGGTHSIHKIFASELGHSLEEHTIDQLKDDLEEENLTVEEDEACACPGCGCKPGEGLTDSCTHEEGCGYFKQLIIEEASLQFGHDGS